MVVDGLYAGLAAVGGGGRLEGVEEEVDVVAAEYLAPEASATF